MRNAFPFLVSTGELVASARGWSASDSGRDEGVGRRESYTYATTLETTPLPPPPTLPSVWTG